MNDYKQFKCVFCNTEFSRLIKSGKRTIKYCSPLCRNRANHQKAIDDGRLARRYDELYARRRAEILSKPQTCVLCGRQFFSERKHKRCPECVRRKEWAELEWTHGFRRPPCKWCGKRCTWHGNKGYCSRECAGHDISYQFEYEKRKNERLFELGLYEYLPDEFLAKIKPRLIKRVVRLLKTALRKKRDEKQREPKPKVCRYCGKVFERASFRFGSWAYCSKECFNAVVKERRRKYRKTEAGKEYKRSSNNNRKRARKFNCEYDASIRSKKVFERDGWRCRICGRKTPEKLRGTLKPNAPTLDHIIPLSLGGGHTWKNVQCACRQCNSEKSNRFAEPWLFPL